MKNFRRDAFSLVELLVVIAIVAVVLSIALVTLARSRESGRTAACLAGMRDIQTRILMYTQDFKSLFPYGIGPGFTSDRLRTAVMDPSGPDVLVGYGWLNGDWDLAILRADSRPLTNELACPVGIRRRGNRLPGESGVVSDRDMSMAMYLDPVALDPAAPAWVVDHFRPQRLDSVSLPSSKAMLYESAPYHDPRARWEGPTVSGSPFTLTVGSTDGATSLRSQKNSLGVVFPQQRGTPEMIAIDNAFRYTPDGVRGFDWR